MRKVFARLVDLTYDLSGSDSTEPMKLKGQDWPEGTWFMFYGCGSFVHFVHPDGYEFTINEDGKTLQLYVHERNLVAIAHTRWGTLRGPSPDWVEAYRSGTHLVSPAFMRTLKHFWAVVESGVLVEVKE